MRIINDPGLAHYWPQTLPSPGQVKVVRRMLDAGVPYRIITSRTGVSSNRITHIRRRPELYDPVNDPVAIERALAGDGSVLPTLTLFERWELRDRLIERVKREPYSKELHNHPHTTGEKFWLYELGEMWGVPPRRLASFINKNVQRGRETAA